MIPTGGFMFVKLVDIALFGPTVSALGRMLRMPIPIGLSVEVRKDFSVDLAELEGVFVCPLE